MHSEPNSRIEIAEPPEPPTKLWVAAFGVYLVVLNLSLLYLLLRLWPGQIPMKADHLPVMLIPGLLVVDVWTDVRFLALVAVAGAFGSYIHLATSFLDFAGNRQLMRSWEWWYDLRPFGSRVAVIV
jgi:hypothetical protein